MGWHGMAWHAEAIACSAQRSRACAGASEEFEGGLVLPRIGFRSGAKR